MDQTGITDTAAFVRNGYMTHDLHLNSRGKKLTHLIAQRINGEHVSCISSIPVI
jgi:hypothetical protein